MSSKAIALICLLALTATAGAADTIVSAHTGHQYWEYTVDFADANADEFRVYLCPNMLLEYLTNISDDSADWALATSGSLDTYIWTDVTPNVTLTYLKWTKADPFEYDAQVVFSFEDALYKPDGIHVMDLANHPGPLLYNPPAYAGAPSAETLGGFTPQKDSGHWVAITPEPATMTLLGLGLIGIAGFVRRRRGT